MVMTTGNIHVETDRGWKCQNKGRTWLRAEACQVMHINLTQGHRGVAMCAIEYILPNGALSHSRDWGADIQDSNVI